MNKPNFKTTFSLIATTFFVQTSAHSTETINMAHEAAKIPMKTISVSQIKTPLSLQKYLLNLTEERKKADFKTWETVKKTITPEQQFSLDRTIGGDGSGGGDSVQNPITGGRSLLDLQENDELKEFSFEMINYDRNLNTEYQRGILGCMFPGANSNCENAYLPGRELSKLDDSLVQALATCDGITKYVDSSFKLLFGDKIKPLKWVFIQTPLEEINDEGLIRVTNPETKRQVAIQKNGLVVINQPEFNLMDNTAKAALKFHELALCAAKTTNPDLVKKEGTEPVRYFVRQFTAYAHTKDKPEGTPATAVTDAGNVFAAQTMYVDLSAMSAKVVMKGLASGQTCELYIHSSKFSEPNVLSACGGFTESYTWMKFSLSENPKALVIVNPGYSQQPVYVDVSQKLIRKNLSKILQSWNKAASK